MAKNNGNKKEPKNKKGTTGNDVDIVVDHSGSSK